MVLFIYLTGFWVLDWSLIVPQSTLLRPVSEVLTILSYQKALPNPPFLLKNQL